MVRLAVRSVAGYVVSGMRCTYSSRIEPLAGQLLCYSLYPQDSSMYLSWEPVSSSLPSFSRLESGYNSEAIVHEVEIDEVLKHTKVTMKRATKRTI
jgi:hypothetical protein